MIVSRSLIILIVLVFAPLSCVSSFADVVEVPEMKNMRRVGTVYQLSVTPAKETVPAFKYRMTIEPHKTIPGNAITHYLRSLGENSLDSPWEAARNEFGMAVHDWYSLETNAEDIPLDKLKTAAGYFDSYVDNHLRRATLCRDCDWGLAVEDLRGPETVFFMLPSVQQTRSMARALKLRNRLAVIEGRYDDSVDHLRMTYQLGQNVNEMKFLVANLVGIAEVAMANEGMLELIAAKDSPNMYWAVAELPQPIISIRDALRLESSFALRYFPGLMEVETADYSDERWREVLTEFMASLIELQKIFSGPSLRLERNVSSEWWATAVGLSGYASAKQRLLDSGMDADKVEAMPVAQVILIDAARDCRLFSNDAEKSYYLPVEKANEFAREVSNRRRAASPTRLGALIVDQFSPALTQVREAELRVQAQINVLMAIESIRNHIATTGKLPNSLGDLKLPVRNNPFTNQPINYELKGEAAVLSLPKGQGNPYSVRYEISIAQEK